MNASLWKFEAVTLAGSVRPRLAELSLEIHAGTTAVVGYSGAGKTSLLNLLSGFENANQGRISASLPNEDGRLPLFWVPQNFGLWPHLTVGEHLKSVIPSDGRSQERISELLTAFDLIEKNKTYPDQLSLGERARLSMARALATEAAVLVLDEPLVHVDPARVGKYRHVVRDHCLQTGTSVVIATHSPETVLSEANQAVCLKDGRLVYAGPVDPLYQRPANAELAEFLGPSNWIGADESADWLEIPLEADRCYRPEQIAIENDESGRFVVESAIFAGSIEEVELVNRQTKRQRAFFHRPVGNSLRPGDRVSVKVLVALLLCLFFAGCEETDPPKLDVKEIRYWSMPPDGSSLPAPRSLTVSPDNELYVLDNAGRVLVFDFEKKLLRQWKMPDYDVGKPEGVCVFRDGRIAVADTHYHRIVFFDFAGTVLGMQGELGEEPGQFIYPVAITQDDAENFYVCEYGSNDRIQKFDKAGKFVKAFGSFGTKPGQFQRPSGIVWHDGTIYVSDAFNNRIQTFSDAGKFLGILTSPGKSANFNYPYDITGSASGELFVVEYAGGCVSKLDRSGKLLGRFGTPGRGEGQFLSPWGLTIAPNGSLFVADTENRRIVELRL